MPFLEHQNFMDEMKKLSEILPAEQAVEMVQNLTDTYTDMEGRIADGESKVTETENTWRKKYFDAFFADKKPDDSQEPNQNDEPKNYTFEKLFKEEK